MFNIQACGNRCDHVRSLSRCKLEAHRENIHLGNRGNYNGYKYKLL